MYFCRSWFSNMVSFRYVLVVLNFLHDIFSLRSFHDIFYNFLIHEKHYAMNVGHWSKSISWKYFIFHEMTLKLYFMKFPERKISQCTLLFRNFVKFTGNTCARASFLIKLQASGNQLSAFNSIVVLQITKKRDSSRI